MRITVADIKSPIARTFNICPTDVRLLDYINQACERLLWTGHYEKTYGKFAVTATSSTITWPREIETIERAALATVPMHVRTGWYEFLEHGNGLLSDTLGDSLQLIDRPISCVSTDIVGTNKRIRLYSGGTADAGKIILLQGKNSIGAEIYTEYPLASTIQIRGRNLTLVSSGAVTPYVTTSEDWSTLDSAQKPVTQLPVTVKEYDTVTTLERTLGIWYPDETRPEYRRSLIPNLVSAGLTSQVITVIGKLRHIPIRGDNDWVIPPNLAAIKLMIRAIWLEENDRVQEAAIYEASARKKLEDQTKHNVGLAEQPMPVSYGDTFGSSGTSFIQ